LSWEQIKLFIKSPMPNAIPHHQRLRQVISILLIALWCVAALHGAVHACEMDGGAAQPCAFCMVVGTAVIAFVALLLPISATCGGILAVECLQPAFHADRRAHLRGPPHSR
jgi:hypothetical protein